MAESPPRSSPGAGADFGLGSAGAAPSAPSCLVLGNFDGVHIGHQAILTRARQRARQRGLQLVAITFEPHPKAFLHPGQGPALLTPLELRRRLLLEAGVERLWVIPFDLHLARLSPEEFMDRVRRRLQLRAMVVGPLFSVGPPGQGELGFITEYGQRTGLEVVEVGSRLWQGEAVSSSRIRARLLEGDLEASAAMLGRPFQVLGPVVRGRGVGRELGFPTANLRLGPGQALPPDGVYVMEALLPEGRAVGAVGSIGVRPHFGGGERVFEVHCLEPVGELYGRQLTVSVLSRLRGQERFTTDAALVERMTRDAEAAAAYLASRPGLSRVPPGPPSG